MQKGFDLFLSIQKYHTKIFQSTVLTEVPMAAPISPYSGIRIRLSTMFNTKADDQYS